MPILKFEIKDSDVHLQNLRIVDITEDPRTKLLNKSTFYKDMYKAEDNIYIFENDLFFKFSKFFNKDKEINAMCLKDLNNIILIVPSRSYVFVNGKSVDVSKYEINMSEVNIGKLLHV